MRYTEARELVEAAIDILMEDVMSTNKNKYPMKKIGSTPAPVAKPVAKPAGSSTTPSPAVKMGARNTSARWHRGNRWVLKQYKKANAAKVGNVTEAAKKSTKKAKAAAKPWTEKDNSEHNIKTFQGHIDSLRDAIDYHSRRTPGQWSDRHGYDTKKSIDAKVKDLIGIHRDLIARHKQALANHAAGNYAANRGHYILNHDWH